jgi:hypothetical protein
LFAEKVLFGSEWQLFSQKRRERDKEGRERQREEGRTEGGREGRKFLFNFLHLGAFFLWAGLFGFCCFVVFVLQH